ncbi:hypothetical protein J2Z35_000245 [Acetoanaerobium pronyense]|uniref:Copper amine oxidase-like N-terminal domain-containing protein n=1 Tax=Acetoanaerobium pronyense TaxID=1482736 RepID=A0ABS4KFB1_9FIRM|nr:copper amine oxidase N-terminal domain-containing protein [Acetoanaerobium pronyense]MBP2026456.1 hypothetical protein [Acetoanaerobium pronyense]
MKKVLLTALIGFILIFSAPADASALTYAKGIILDGQQIETDVAPIIESGRTLVPVKGVLESMGATVTWDQETKTATAFLGENSTSVTIGNKTAYVNGYAVTLDVPAKIVDGRTMVPLRFMAESIGYSVAFEDGWVYLSGSQDESTDFYALLDQFDTDFIQGNFQEDEITFSTSYNDTENAVVISIVMEGGAEEVRGITQDENLKNDWKELIEVLKELSIVTIEYFGDNYYDVNSIVEIINDESQNYVLFSIKNGDLVYAETETLY